MTLFYADEDVLPDYSELEDLPVPDAALDGRRVSFDQVRHEFDQMFESDAIPDIDSPEAIAVAMENVTQAYQL